MAREVRIDENSAAMREAIILGQEWAGGISCFTQLLLDDVGIIPLYHSPDYVLTKPYEDGFAIGPLDIPLLKNVTIGDR